MGWWVWSQVWIGRSWSVEQSCSNPTSIISFVFKGTNYHTFLSFIESALEFLPLMTWIGPSFQIVRTRKITRLDRVRAWNELRRAAREKKTRPFYRAVNKNGFMYAGNYMYIYILFGSTHVLFKSCPILSTSG